MNLIINNKKIILLVVFTLVSAVIILVSLLATLREAPSKNAASSYIPQSEIPAGMKDYYYNGEQAIYDPKYVTTDEIKKIIENPME